VIFNWLPVTPDQILVTAGLVPAWSMAFVIDYGLLELLLATTRGAMHSRRSRRRESLELVDNDARLPVLGDARRAKFAMWELLACAFRGDSVMVTLPRQEWPVVTVCALKSLLELASVGRGGPDGPALVQNFRQQFPPFKKGYQRADSDLTAVVTIGSKVELPDLFHDILQHSLVPYARAIEHSSLPYKLTSVVPQWSYGQLLLQTGSILVPRLSSIAESFGKLRDLWYLMFACVVGNTIF